MLTSHWKSFLKQAQYFHFGILCIVLMMLAMIILPVPPFLLDLFFTSNITLSLIVLLLCIYVYRPLEFSIFPTILLITTLLRLTLNIASTRVVLLHGHQGASAAGDVIRAFGEVVIGGNFVVGMIVFAILMIINFVVVTKGAGRISEVSARFTLDAMPGKQMSIDSDLNAGLITQEDAKKRRSEVIQEADFYGAMDGASKFVRGDAVAGLLILCINLIGGIIIGVFQNHLPLEVAVKTFSLLTIGDGLVAQIPALLMSVAAAIIVTRVSSEQDVREQAVIQLFTNPKPLLIVGSILLILGLVPGMPHLSFFLLAAACFAGIFVLKQKSFLIEKNKENSEVATKALPGSLETVEIGWDDVVATDRVVLEIGYGLISLVGTAQEGLLIHRIKGIRKKLSLSLGFLIPTVHVKDNLSLPADHYRIYLKNVVMAEARVYCDMQLAINPGHLENTLAGIPCKDPTFGLEAYWIDSSEKESAQNAGFTVVDASTVIATHLNHLIFLNASSLLGYDEVQNILNKLSKNTPKLVEILLSSTQGIPLPTIVTVLQHLLQSGIPIIDMRTIAEKMIETWAKVKELDYLIESVRIALKHLIVYRICSDRQDVPVAIFQNELAQILHKSIQQQGVAHERRIIIEPSLSEKIYTKLLEYVKQCEIESMPAIMLVATELRGLLEKMFKSGIPSMHFLSHNEIPEDRQLNIVAQIGWWSAL